MDPFEAMALSALGLDGASSSGLSQQYLDAIRRTEYAGNPDDPRFTRPFWDVRQWTSGYGTRAGGPDERVDRAELERRFDAEIANAHRSVRAFAPNLDEGTTAALTSLTYNAGPRWQQERLGQAIRAGNIPEARQLFLAYRNAAGQPLPGLAARREREAAWFGQSGSGTSPMADPFDAYAASVASPSSAVAAPAAMPAPASQDVRNAPQAQGWTQWLSQPANRAFLMSAGAQMMMPSFSGPMGNLGMALSQGQEAAAGTERMQRDQDLAQQQLRSREQEGALDRASRERIADTYSDSRVDVANVRSQAMLERARLIGARNPQVQQQFGRLVQQFMSTLTRDNPIAGAGRRTSEQLHEQAMQLAETTLRQQGLLEGPGATPVAGAPAATPATPGATPAAPAPAPAPRSGKGSTQQLVPPRPAGSTDFPPQGEMALQPPASGAPAAAPATPAGGGLSWEQFLANPQSAALLRNTRARTELMQRRPDWAPMIQEYMRTGR